jgi:hypothetical protein
LILEIFIVRQDLIKKRLSRLKQYFCPRVD